MNVEHDQSKWNILPDYLPVTKAKGPEAVVELIELRYYDTSKQSKQKDHNSRKKCLICKKLACNPFANWHDTHFKNRNFGISLLLTADQIFSHVLEFYPF